MDGVVGLDLQNPAVYLLANIAVWTATVGTVQSIFSGDGLIGAVIGGALGGLAFGLTSLFLRRRTRD